MNAQEARTGARRYDVESVQQELSEIATSENETLEGMVTEAPPEVEQYRKRVGKQLDILEDRFDQALEGTKLHGYLRTGALVVSILFVLVGIVIKFLYPEQTVGDIGTLAAGGGLVGGLTWIMSFILSNRKQDIGLSLTIARYRVQLAASNSVEGIQKIADELSKVLAEMG